MRLKNKDKRLKILVIVTVSVAIVIAYWGGAIGKDPFEGDAFLLNENAAATEGSGTSDKEKGDDAEAAPIEETSIFVHMAGAVVNPGVYELQEGSRIFEALQNAGGLSPDGNDSTVNLAAKLSDGERVYIPTDKEVKDMGSPLVGSTAGNSSGNSTGGGTVVQKININTADSAALQEIKGIGPSMAERIIQYRTETGKFEKIEDLKNVKGIGDKTFERLKDQVKVN